MADRTPMKAGEEGYTAKWDWDNDTEVILGPNYPEDMLTISDRNHFKFASEHDHRLMSGSPLIDAGILVEGYEDYEGQAPDVGAYEYGAAGSAGHWIAGIRGWSPSWNGAPSASFDYADGLFDASKSQDDQFIMRYDWDFGDGSTGYGIMPQHNYSHAGSYTVKLSVTDNLGKVSTFSKKVKVLPTPVVHYSMLENTLPTNSVSGKHKALLAGSEAPTYAFPDSLQLAVITVNGKNNKLKIDGYAGPSDDRARTQAFWVRQDSASYISISSYGQYSSGAWNIQKTASGKIRVVTKQGNFIESLQSLDSKRWNHIAVSYPGNGAAFSATKIYFNAEETPIRFVGSDDRVATQSSGDALLALSAHTPSYLSEMNWYDQALDSLAIKVVYQENKRFASLKVLCEGNGKASPMETDRPKGALQNVVVRADDGNIISSIHNNNVPENIPHLEPGESYIYPLHLIDDTLLELVFETANTLDSHEEAFRLQIGPNPTREFIQINSEIRFAHCTLYSMQGHPLMAFSPDTKSFRLKLEHLPEGYYILELINKDHTFRKPILIIN